MFKKLSNWIKRRELEFDILNSKLDLLKSKPDIVLMRHMLGSIDLSDVKEEEMTEGQRAEYCNTISAVYPVLEKDIKRLLYAQLMFASNQAETWDGVIFGRGTFNGMDILLEHWKKAYDEHIAKTRPKEAFDSTQILSEI